MASKTDAGEPLRTWNSSPSLLLRVTCAKQGQTMLREPAGPAWQRALRVSAFTLASMARGAAPREVYADVCERRLVEYEAQEHGA